MVAILHAHDPLKNELLRDFSIHCEGGGGDAKRLAGQSCEAFDIMLGAHCGIEAGLDLTDAGGFENKDIAGLGLGEVVADLVHKHLVAGIHVAAGNDFAGGVFAAWQHAEVAHERVAGHEECVDVVATKAKLGGGVSVGTPTMP